MQTTHRFSDRVENYLKYRPRYPAAAIDHLVQIAALTGGSSVADIGSGTGFSAEPFLQRGCTVYGVEPNEPMRLAAEELLSEYPKFQSVNATAEATTLPDNSVDAILCAQAFHWFDRTRARAEFHRIAKPGSVIALIWNARLTHTPFLREYESLLQQFGTDYSRVNHENIGTDEIVEFLGPRSATTIFKNHQHFNLEGLRGRLLSSSYVPLVGQRGHDQLFAGMERLFSEQQKDGHITLEYDTKVYTVRI